MKFLLFVSALLFSVTSSISVTAEENYTWQRIEICGEDYLPALIEKLRAKHIVY